MVLKNKTLERIAEEYDPTNAFPTDEVRGAARELLAAREVLREMEWSSVEVIEPAAWFVCPVCKAKKRDGTHDDDCKLAALIPDESDGA